MAVFDWRARLRAGTVIPAHPLALTSTRKLDERRQHKAKQDRQGDGYNDLATKIERHYNDYGEDRCGHGTKQRHQIFCGARFEWLSDHTTLFPPAGAEIDHKITISPQDGSDGVIPRGTPIEPVDPARVFRQRRARVRLRGGSPWLRRS